MDTNVCSNVCVTVMTETETLGLNLTKIYIEFVYGQNHFNRFKMAIVSILNEQYVLIVLLF